MLCGSVPLGYSEPLKVQLEQGIETNQIQCDNPNHVLVQRNNGKLACVSEGSSEKMNWEIIETGISLVEYEFPLTAKHPEMTSNVNGEPSIQSYSDVELQISNLPKLGESAEIIVIVTNNLLESGGYTDDEWDGVSFTITNNLQVITGLEDFTQFDPTMEYDYTSYSKEIPIGKIPIHTFKITVVAFGTGESNISARTSGDFPTAKASFDLVIGETETLLKDDYYKKYPSKLAEKMSSIEDAKQLAIQEEALAEEELLDQGCYFVEKIGMFCPPTEEELEEMRVNEDDESISSEEELRAYLKSDGASDEEIEEIVRED